MAKENPDQKIIELAKERFKNCQEFWSPVYQEALDDLKFRAGDQWPQEILNSRKSKGRPHLTINKIPQFVRQIANEMRQNKPAIKVYPVDDKADIEVAKIRSGVIRNIEYSSNAEVAYNTAGECAVDRSIGFFRLVSDYVSHNSFNQELRILPVYNPFSCYMDPATQELDGSDQNFCFTFDEVSKYQLEAEYPELEKEIVSDHGGWDSLVDGDWFNKEKARVVEYYYKEFKNITVYRLDVMGEEVIVESKEEIPEGAVIVEERKALKPQVKWCKMIGCKVLEKTDWPGSWIPLIPVFGSRYYLDGRWHIESVFRQAKDSQRMFNYMKSYEAEAIGRAPKAPYMVAEGQIPKGYEGMWQSANTEDYAYMVYKPTEIGGQLVGAPQRQAFEPAIQAMTQAAMLASDDIKATTGIYDASLGARSNEQSGIAIQRRNMQAQTSNYHFIDNQAISIRHCGRQINELIPVIYSDSQVLRMIGEDGSPEFANLLEKQLKIDDGKYDVVVDVGPSYATKRQESAENLLNLMKTIPGQAPLIADLAVKNLDFPDAQALAERLTPPQFKKDAEAPIPPELQAQIQQMQMILQEQEQQLKAQADIIANKKLELQAKNEIELYRIETQKFIELAKLDSKESIEGLKQDLSLFKEEYQRTFGQLEFDPSEQPQEIENEVSTESGNYAGPEGT
jgi:hypothetical protein